MKTINAEQNNDGTWHVTIKNKYTRQDLVNGMPVKEDCVSTTDIPRADIKIIAYKNMDDDETILTLIV